MRLGVEKLRWGLLVGGGSLLLLLAGFLGYSRYRAVRAWRNILARSGATLTRETNGFTYSQSVGGRTVFTLHAAKAVQAKDGKYALHDVSLLLYRQADVRPDRIYGSDFEYDEKTGVARALGEVHMDLQAPGVLHGPGAKKAAQAEVGESSTAGQAGDPEDEPETIHVKTSGLVYVRKLGVAATDQDVEFGYGSMQCHARGAEFDAGQSTVHLLADVQVSGTVRGTALTLTAARADLDRGSNVATLSRPEVQSEKGSAGAGNAVLHLTSNGLLQSAQGTGAVHATRGTEVVQASHAEAEFSADSTLREARFSGGVTFADTDTKQPMQGHAQKMEASFGPHGSAQSMVAEGDVSVQAARLTPGASEPPSLRREMRGQRIEAKFQAMDDRTKPALREVRIDGEAHASGQSYVRSKPEGSATLGTGFRPARSGGLAQTQVSADALLLTFASGPQEQPQPDTLTGTGRTVLEEALPGGSTRRSTGDRLKLQFAPSSKASPHTASSGGGSANSVADTQVASAVQEGHVTWRSVSLHVGHTTVSNAGDAKRDGSKPREDVSEGAAQRVEFEADEHRVSLTGQAHLSSAEGDLTAGRVDLDTETGDAKAQGEVRITSLSGAARDKTAVSESTHIAASEARFAKASNTAEFRGTDAVPVRLWQAGSQLEAAIVFLDHTHDTLSAKAETPAGFVHAVLVQGRSGAEKTMNASPDKQISPGKKLVADSGVLRVTSSRLEYSGAAREATFFGGVRTSGALGQAQSQTAVVFLGPAGAEASFKDKAQTAGKIPKAQAASTGGLLGGSVEKVVLAGKVQIEQPGRYGTGEQLLYTAATSSFVLTGLPGRPPRLVDAAQGSVTGGTLLFRTSDNTVVVAGDSPHAGTAGGRVRTELNLHP